MHVVQFGVGVRRNALNDGSARQPHAISGVGYVLDSEWPAWLITIIDGVAAFLLWCGYRRGSSSPSLGLVLTSVASELMLALVLWMVLVSVSVAKRPRLNPG
jgi:hypothetical protein